MLKLLAILPDIQTWPNSRMRHSQSPKPKSITMTGVFMRVDKSSALQELPINKPNAILIDMRIFKLNSETKMNHGFKPRSTSTKLVSEREDFTSAKEVQYPSVVPKDPNANVMVWSSMLQFTTMELLSLPQTLRWISLRLFSTLSDKRTQEITELNVITIDLEISLQAEQSNASVRPQFQESQSHAVKRDKTVDAQAEVKYSMELNLPPLTQKPPS